MKHMLTALFISAALGGSALAQDIQLALQAYTFRDRSFLETIATAKRLGIEYLEAYPGQKIGAGFAGTTNYKTIAPETLKQLKVFVEAQGVKIVSYGVTSAANDAEWRKLMEFAKFLGVGVIQIEASGNRAKLDLAEKFADKYNIKIALHNHRQADGLPDAVLKQLEGRGRNIGAGSDIGHWMSANTRPLDGVRLLKGKFVTLHLVDAEGIGNRRMRPVPYGSGAGEIAAVLDELKAQGFKGYVTLEYEHQSPDLEIEVAACVRWFDAYQAGLLDKNGQLPTTHIDALWDGFAKTGRPAIWDSSTGQGDLAKLANLKMLEIAPGSIKGNKAGYGNGKEGPGKGIGTDAKQKYCQIWDGKAFVTCSLAAPAAASFYTLSSSNDAPPRDPKEWILYGSADAQTWEELDHRSNQKFNQRLQLKIFPIKQPEAFQHYKLEILAHHGHKDMQFSRFALFSE